MQETPRDLAECVQRALAGDQAAARELIERLYPLVSKIVRAHVPDRHQQEEWEQEVFLRMFDRLPQYRGDAPLEHWLAKISVHVCLDALRSRRRRPELRWADLSPEEADLVQTAPDRHAPANNGQALAARELAQKMLDTLEPDDRLIVQMIDMEDRSVADVARLTGRSQTAVKVRAFRARRKLRSVWRRLIDEPPAERT